MKDAERIAELYDEVWEKARDMGYGNVTDALVELERMNAAPAQPAAHDHGDVQRLREALGGMLEVYGGERDADGLPKHEVELNMIAFAYAALATSTGQDA